MSIRIVTARWIVTGTAEDGEIQMMDDAAIAKKCAIGSPLSAQRPRTSNWAHHWKTDTAKASTQGSAMSC